MRSIIPKDNSSLVVATIAEHPIHDSKDLNWALGKANLWHFVTIPGEVDGSNRHHNQKFNIKCAASNELKLEQ
ncbi:8945_t:CDS:2, partial [Racocetra fulgida]